MLGGFTSVAYIYLKSPNMGGFWKKRKCSRWNHYLSLKANWFCMTARWIRHNIQFYSKNSTGFMYIFAYYYCLFMSVFKHINMSTESLRKLRNVQKKQVQLTNMWIKYLVLSITNNFTWWLDSRPSYRCFSTLSRWRQRLAAQSRK